MPEKNLTAAEQEISIGFDRLYNGGFAIQVSGNSTGLELEVEGTVHTKAPIEWFPLSVESYNDRSYITQIVDNGGFWGNAIALAQIRARVGAITNGTARVSLEAKQG